jgi:ankyrin repeat protein
MKKAIILLFSAALLISAPVYASEIHDASDKGDTAEVKTLLSKQPDLVNAKNEKGSTPLHLASFKGHLEVVKFLLEKGADIEAINGGGFTSLQLAAYGGHRDVVEFLIDKGSNLNAINKQMGMTVLDFAFMREMQARKLDIAPFLIEKGAEFDVNKKNQSGYTFLDMAIVFGYTEAVEYLLGFGADISTLRKDGRTPLINAIFRGRPQIADLLIEKGADVNAPDNEGQPPIYWAVKKGLADVVKMLIAKGAATDYVEKDYGRTLLHVAVLQGNKDVVDLLVDENLDVNAKDSHDKTPLFYAAKYGHNKTAFALVKYGAKKTNDMEENYGKSPYLTGQFKERQAVAWYLANRGWAIKTKNHMLIFDAEEFGVIRPAEPFLANGFLTPYEIRDQNVFAIYTCYHGEPGEPAYIHTIEDSLASITYVHNEADAWRGSEKTVYMKPREVKKLADIQIVSISILESMPVLGYLCTVDGMNIFYSSFQPEDINKYKEEIDSLTQYASEVDLAFLPIAEPGEENPAVFYFMEKLHPKAIFPLDPDNRELLYPDMAKMISGKGFKTEVFCAENPGDHFIFRGSQRK